MYRYAGAHNSFILFLTNLFHYLFYGKKNIRKPVSEVFRQAISCTGMSGHTTLSFFFKQIFILLFVIWKAKESKKACKV